MPVFPPAALPPVAPGLLRRLVDWMHSRFFPNALDDAGARWAAALVLVLVSVVIGRFVVSLSFAKLKKLMAKANNQLMVPALEPPAATFVVLCGIVAALSVIPVWDEVPRAVILAEQGALTAVVLWAVACAGGAVIDHFAVEARARKLQIAAFIPLIRRSVFAFFAVFSVLVVFESLGFEVKTFLTGLGIGGLAFALAAQDTIANMFGSFVVVMDQPFFVGEYIRILTHEGTVEEIGLRSTRLRTAARTQVVIPNKTVAAEVITNFSRMPQRRVDTTIGITYDNPPERIEAGMAALRAYLRSDPSVHPGQVVVSFADFGDSALKVQILYFTADPDWEGHMAVRERVNLGILRTLATSKISLSYPAPVIRLDAPTAQAIKAL